MARALFEFSWTLRLHEEAAVRRAALLATCTVGQTISAGDDDLAAEIGGLQMWLGHVAAHEVDEGCRCGPAACLPWPAPHIGAARSYPALPAVHK